VFVNHFSLDEDFKFLFGEHFKAISGGITEVFRNSKFSELDQNLKKKINIRTRNYQKKQPVHNTQLKDVLSITKILTGNNFKVTNIESSPLSLKSHLSKEELMNYEEFDDLTLDDELKITSGPIICRADAGLFVLMSCLPNPLVVLSEEWSSFLGISLLEARKIAGLNLDKINLVDFQNKNQLLLSMHRYFEKEF
jgi:hypothetical protein